MRNENRLGRRAWYLRYVPAVWVIKYMCVPEIYVLSLLLIDYNQQTPFHNS